jgi:hypothetical protein
MIKRLSVALFILASASGAALAQNCGPLPNNLTNGQLADANQLMANFNFIINCINGGREILTASRTYYVRTDGADANNGLTNSPSGAFLTWQHAVDVVRNKVNLNGNTVTIQAGGTSGTFTGSILVVGPFVGASTNASVQLIGDAVTPSNFLLQTTTSASVVAADAGAFFAIKGFELKSTGGGYLIDNRNGGIILVNGAMVYDNSGGN